MLDWQLIVVLVVVAVAFAYTARSFMRQFRRSDDEQAGCTSCPAAGDGDEHEHPAPR